MFSTPIKKFGIITTFLGLCGLILYVGMQSAIPLLLIGGTGGIALGLAIYSLGMFVSVGER